MANWSALKPLIVKLSVGLFLTMILAIAGTSQTITGTITGTVIDPNGGVIPGATVTLLYKQTGATRIVSTNDEGRFAFAAVQPGVYSIKIEHAGFQTLLRENSVLSANENLALGDIGLTTGSVNETVTISSVANIVEIENSDLSARLTADQLNLISTKG